jgi:hypothetical protein
MNGWKKLKILEIMKNKRSLYSSAGKMKNHCLTSFGSLVFPGALVFPLVSLQVLGI